MEGLAFIELTLADGSALWLAAGAIYAIEKSPNERTTVVRTPSEPFMVVDSPQSVMDKMRDAFAPQFDSTTVGLFNPPQDEDEE